MKLEVLKQVHVHRTNGPDEHLTIGAVVEFSDVDALLLMLRAPSAVRPVVQAEVQPCKAPLKNGWAIVYRRTRHDRPHDGIVSRCERTGNYRIVQLTNGTRIPLEWITSVGKTDGAGKVVAAWTVYEHGFDGEGTGR